MERNYEAFWVFEEEAFQQESRRSLRNRCLVSSHCYEGKVVITDNGIILRGKSIVTGEPFEVSILFSKIIKMEKVSPHNIDMFKVNASEKALRIIYDEQGKSKCVLLQEKLVELEEKE